MMIRGIDMLRNQRFLLEAAPERRMDLYNEMVAEPLRPFWESMLAKMPPGQDTSDPAALMGVYTPDLDDREGIAAIDWLERADSWRQCLEAIEQAERLLRPADHGIVLDNLLYSLVLANPVKFGHLHGYTGFGGTPGQAIVLVWPSEYNVPRLPSITAHEYHHNIRLSYEPWSAETTVGQYIVVEGLAEAFAAEMYGADKLGPWVHSLDEEQHERVKPMYREALVTTGFPVILGYMFGNPQAGIPAYAGYSVGYRVVNEYLRHSGVSVVEATYRPWQEIIEKSRYF
ncbi:DUF2268 domain-containing protein [Paenibacillus mesophilus]|uniref:DUF2268 domain-containing protein n=1 Tax=Paenibacillus mesophilus TaxID=2582849 RepID=UPI0013050BE8|nr:DUF2268 domain-containing putative Zn-dependent protease [Paenibacillus mesophilus]